MACYKRRASFVNEISMNCVMGKWYIKQCNVSFKTLLDCMKR